ncbi:IS3 family transposase [Cytobacillus solani]|nr:integrase core domain-containing protein [Cytobacillus solani]
MKDVGYFNKWRLNKMTPSQYRDHLLVGSFI